MSASREKKGRQNLTGLSESQKKAAIEAKQNKKKAVIYTVLGVAAAAAVVALLVWDSGVFQRNATAYTVGDRKYTVADVDYFYHNQYNTYYPTYSSFGLISTESPLDEQVYSTDEDGNEQSWYDFFLSQGLSSLTEMSVLSDQAAAAGYTISEDGKAQVEELFDSIKESCSTYNVSEQYYITATYGQYMTAKHLRELTTQYITASEYSEKVYNDYADAVTEDEINSYYSEHADDLDTYTYHVYSVNGAAASTTDADGNTVEPTEEESAAALETAKATAEELKTAVESGDAAAISAITDAEDSKTTDQGNQSTIGSSVSSSYAEWVKDASRTAGDVTMIEDGTTCYVISFEGRELDEFHPVTYRDILIKAEVDDGASAPTADQLAAAKAKAEELLSQVTDEASFSALVADNSADSSTSSTEGLNESATRTKVSDSNVNAWLFNETRTDGETALVENADGTGYYALYFVSYDEKSYWQQTAISAMASEDYDEWYTGVSADVATAEAKDLSKVIGK